MLIQYLCLLSLLASALGRNINDTMQNAGRAYVEDLNNDHARRNFGLPEELRFRLRHASGIVDLNLRENKHLNLQAPMFGMESDGNGQKRMVKFPTPEMTVKHYQDKRYGAFLTVDCVTRLQGPCARTLKGNLVINGQEYSLEPVARSATNTRLHGNREIPHTLTPIQTDHSAPERRLQIHDYLIVTEAERRKVTEKRNKEEREHLMEVLLKRLEDYKSLQKRATGPVAHGIEMFLAIDHVIYQKFAKLHEGKDQTLLKIREYFSHIINGVDLRYGTIQKDDISFYVTVSGFYISKSVGESPWMDYNVTYPDGMAGLAKMVEWHTQFPKHDHAALMVGVDFQSGGSNLTAGLAYVGEVCNAHGVSINEDISFFKTSAVLAHELGHSLGSRHDGDEESKDCNKDDKYIMQPYVPELDASSTTIKPWRFSECSIKAMRTTVNGLGTTSCTLNRGSVWDPEEFKLHTKGLAGQIYTVDEQCELLKGDNSMACEGTTNIAEICRSLQCTIPGTKSCSSDTFTAAHGTPCGQNKMCFEGLCINAKNTSSTESPRTDSPNTEAPGTTATNSEPPITNAATTDASVTGAPSSGTMGTGASSSGTMGTDARSLGTMGTDAPSSGTMVTGAPSSGTMGTGASSSGTMGTDARSLGTMGTDAPSSGTMGTDAPSLGTMVTGAPSSGTMGTGAPSSGTMGTGAPTEQQRSACFGERSVIFGNHSKTCEQMDEFMGPGYTCFYHGEECCERCGS